ncbi:ABC transporter substrate-binding protein, partial [Klebsiella pneumoniae]|nr:ABC transporter substrate-binding protein [Klebsiella pneumoniae]
KEKGLDLKVEYARLGGGAPLNDALLSDSVQIASAGVAPMLTLWDKTSKNYGVKGLSAINASPMYLLTNKESIKSIKDFGPDDR